MQVPILFDPFVGLVCFANDDGPACRLSIRIGLFVVSIYAYIIMTSDRKRALIHLYIDDGLLDVDFSSYCRQLCR